MTYFGQFHDDPYYQTGDEEQRAIEYWAEREPMETDLNKLDLGYWKSQADRFERRAASLFDDLNDLRYDLRKLAVEHQDNPLFQRLMELSQEQED